ncbi:MAG: hypothetical protein B0W54_07930 [Cellvibrio sp. 79]|nr:MAG: hypothetical protein B0W54_07930 [Cellvibrio sp. 79]
MSSFISPHFYSEKLDSPNVDDLIDVYEDRIQHWIVEPAKLIANTEHGGPAAFCILLTYFESAWSFAQGKSSHRNSKEYFINGFADVFKASGYPEYFLYRTGEIIYVDARCGFFHDGLFRGKIFFAEMNKDIVITLPKRDGRLDLDGEIQSIIIEPKRCADAIERHLQTTIRELRKASNDEQRKVFFDFFKSRCDWDSPGPMVAIQPVR